MRTAALPSFRKLYRRVDHDAKFYQEGLRRGNYTLFVTYCKYIGLRIILLYLSYIFPSQKKLTR